MTPPRSTFPHPLTLRQPIFSISTHRITTALSLMARLTKVSVSPAKPLRYVATIFAFKLHEVYAMFWAILDRDLAAIRTH